MQLAGGMYAAPTGEMRLLFVGVGLIPPLCCSSTLLQLAGNRRRCVAAKEGVAAVQLEGGVNPAPTMSGGIVAAKEGLRRCNWRAACMPPLQGRCVCCS